MRKVSLLLVLLVLLAVAACGQGRAPVAPTRTPTPVVPGATPPVAALSLAVMSPKDEVVVKDAILRVVGRTSPDAVVSVDGKIVRTVDIDGNFSALVSLVEGPNLLEVLATDYRGGQASQVLTVVYTPQG